MLKEERKKQPRVVGDGARRSLAGAPLLSSRLRYFPFIVLFKMEKTKGKKKIKLCVARKPSPWTGFPFLCRISCIIFKIFF